jgi:diaminopimelate decarboxylase
MKPINLNIEKIGNIIRKALSNGLIRDEDTLVMFHDLDFLEERIIHLKSVFPDQTLHAIAMKANPLLQILKNLRVYGIGAEVASLPELQMALKCGYSSDKIVFDSPVKTWQELESALIAGVHINIDSFAELDRITKLIESINTRSSIGIRINPQVGIGSIAESSVAGECSKFGIPIKSGRQELIGAFLKYPWLKGVHLHVGSQGCSKELLLTGIRTIYDIFVEINDKRKLAGMEPVSIFDIGGGLPISYIESQIPFSLTEYVNDMHQSFPSLFNPQVTLITEFGRCIHVNAGWTVSRVEYVKHENTINTAMIHAGADLFIRECLTPKSWQHKYSVFDKSGTLKDGSDNKPYNLAGPLCFSGDILARDVKLPVIEEGDFIIIHDTGGYTLSMWSRYNSRQIPRILGYHGEEFEILKERESPDDVARFWV